MKVRITKVEVNLSAEEWDLYTTSMDCNAAAEALNTAVEQAVQEGLDRDGVEDAVQKVQNQWSKFGAADSEPRYVLREVLDRIFPRAAA